MSIGAGTRLGSYEIVARIGAGGMGEVYRAHDRKLKRDVAIKVLPDAVARDPDRASRFAHEAELLASLNHPNLAAIHTIDEHDGQPFIVMELLRGRTLRSAIEGPSLPATRILELTLQLTDGLSAAHTHGVIHRDIKPENIYITEDGFAKILDFGLAKLLPAGDLTGAPTMAAGLTEAGSTLGTASYMSPEQVRGEDLDRRTDLFSLGMVLFEMTTGRRPFEGATSGVVFDAILNRAPAPLRQFAPHAPDELQRIVGKLLEKDRRLRYQSAADLRVDLERLKREIESGSRLSMPATALDIERRSIVVRPFNDLSPGKDKEYFADGLTDEIIIDLSQLQAIRVISRNSSLQLKSTTWDLKTIARELQVQYVLEGTVRTAGDNLRVTAQLVDVANGQNMWADKYSGRLEDVFDIQERISRQIVEALQMKLSPREDRRLAERQITNVHAYECYQQARRDIYTFTEAGLDRARRSIQDALVLVGDSELLYATLGTVYWQYVNAAIRPDDGFLDMAAECAEKAFRINPESAAGFLLRGLVQLARGRPLEALKDLKHAVAIEPNNAQALQELARVYIAAGQEREARAAIDRWLATDPLSPMSQLIMFGVEFFCGTAERARALAERMLETGPDHAMLRFWHALCLVQADRLDEARQLLAGTPEERIPTIAGGCCRFLTHALDGRGAEALASISEDMKTGARRVEVWSFFLAECYGFLGDADQAMDWLENALRLGFSPYPFLASREVTLAKFRGQPRYDALMLKIKDAWDHFSS